MITKADLLKIQQTNRLIVELKAATIQLRSNLNSITSNMTPDKVQSSHANDQMAVGVAKIIDLETEMQEYITELTDLKADAFRAIRQLSNLDYQVVLIARYIDCKKWPEIIANMKYGASWVYEVHQKALEALIIQGT
ncbi:MAG: DUF1492 domain-containing protein [Acinetobacter sp.]